MRYARTHRSHLCGSASPEGAFEVNRKLAEARLATLESYVRERVSIPEDLINRCDASIAWKRLATLVEQSDMEHKEEALHILRNVPEFTYNENSMLTDSRKKHLMDMQYGRTWNYMKAHFFEKVRNASAVFVTIRPKTMEVAEEAPKDTVQVIVPVDTVVTAQEPEIIQPEERKPFYMSVKTNMLYDALLVPNIGLEFYLGKIGRSPETGCTAGGTRITSTVIGEPTVVTSPSANGSARKPMKSR